MPWIVDGNNLLAQIPGLSMNDPGHRRRLASLLARFCQARRCRVTLYFDGEPLQGWRGSTRLGALGVLHSGAGRSADDRILDQVAAATRPGDLTVVTSDRALSDRCRSMGARTVQVREFRSILAEAGAAVSSEGEKPERPDPAEVDYFLEAFGADGPDPSIRSRRRR